MKHKLINNNTEEETLCDKITIDGFDYYVSDNEIIQGDYYIDFRTDGDKLEHFKEKDDWVLVGICGSKKVIATTNPNIDIPKVVDEVERLANNHGGDEINDDIYFSFISGYNKSQETHPFSEEDMIEFGEFMFSVCKEYQRGGTYVVTKPLDESKTYTAKELLQLWKEQQPKIVYYESN